MEAQFFKTPAAFRKWLIRHHATAKELLVGFYKTSSAKACMTWPESVDEALCFGWIDGIRKSIDPESYSIRFTPRKPNSTWSTINIRKMGALLEAGKMHAAGLAVFEKRNEKRSEIASYEKGRKTLSKELELLLRSNKKAWAFLETQAPSYQKTSAHWVMSAQKEETKLRRLQELIRDSEAGKKIKALSYNGKK